MSGQDQPAFAPGATLAGRYTVERELGRGGMGAVLLARHKDLGTTVAVKVLSGYAKGGDEFVARFVQEAKAASGLKSEFVARVTDFGTLDGGQPFMVMEHLEGEDLGQVLSDGPMPVQEAVDAVLQVSAGLAEAHAAGVVHRDLKPSNLFRTHRPDGSACVKVLDFGISQKREPGSEARLTGTGKVLGTPLYMSPEQIRTPRDLDARTDVWSLGVVLFELLTGRTPFSGEDMGPLLAGILEEAPPRASELRPDVPDALSSVILRMLAKKRDERVPSMAAVAEALAPFGSDEGRIAAQRAARTFSRQGSASRARLHSQTELAETAVPSVAPTPPQAAQARSGTRSTPSHPPRPDVGSTQSASSHDTPPARRKGPSMGALAGLGAVAALGVLGIVAFATRGDGAAGAGPGGVVHPAGSPSDVVAPPTGGSSAGAARVPQVTPAGSASAADTATSAPTATAPTSTASAAPAPSDPKPSPTSARPRGPTPPRTAAPVPTQPSLY